MAPWIGRSFRRLEDPKLITGQGTRSRLIPIRRGLYIAPFNWRQCGPRIKPANTRL